MSRSKRSRIAWNPPGPAIELYPRGEWFNIYYVLTTSGELDFSYINIALPPAFERGVFSYIDLDLDLQVAPDFSYTLHDEDEFLHHCDLWRYPPDLCDRARSTLDDLLDKVASHDPIFGEWERYMPVVPPHFVSTEEAALVPPHDHGPAYEI